MIKTNIKPQWVDIDDFIDDIDRNVRDSNSAVFEAEYNLEPIINDIKLRGQQVAVVAEKVGDKFQTLQGFRRENAIRRAKRDGLIYDDTAPEAGKPMGKILVVVHENLNSRERATLVNDHGQRENLSRVGLQRSFEQLIKADFKEDEMVTILYGLLVSLVPVTRKIEEGPDGVKLEGKALASAKLAYFKSHVQKAKRVYSAPTVLREAWFEKLRGNQKWPTDAELIDLSDIHNREISVNPLLSQDKPGPKFTEAWNRLVKAKTEAAQLGEKPKATSMRNRAQVEESVKQAESPITKAFHLIQLGTISSDKLPILDSTCERLWNFETMTEDERAEIVSWFPQQAAEQQPE